jgi:RNA polymerase sigma-70 factor, ECF subfamily
MAETISQIDEVLLRRIAAGESEALSLLYDRYERVVYSLLCGILKNTDDAEDIMQEVFAQVWKKADTYDASFGSAKNWLLRIAHNRAINQLRSKASRERSQRVPLGDLELTSAGADLTTVNEVLQNDEAIHLNSAIEKLPLEQKSLIALAFLEGLTHSEIASHTSLPLGTVKTRIRSGLMNLRKQLSHLAADYPISSVSRTPVQSTRSQIV